jgi:ribosomal protein S12 methylthiotransferase accessory factor
MATHTGGNKHSGMHAGVVAGDQAHSTTRFNAKDVPQFAPNYSVYVLAPESVCFYSEDRKFFLHG